MVINIIRMFKSRRMIWARHVSRTVDECMKAIVGKTRREDTTGKTKMYVVKNI
jgi:hypothetical protein